MRSNFRKDPRNSPAWRRPRRLGAGAAVRRLGALQRTDSWIYRDRSQRGPQSQRSLYHRGLGVDLEQYGWGRLPEHRRQELYAGLVDRPVQCGRPADPALLSRRPRIEERRHHPPGRLDARRGDLRRRRPPALHQRRARGVVRRGRRAGHQHQRDADRQRRELAVHPARARSTRCALWNVARSTSQIRAPQRAASTGPQAGLVGLWRLDASATEAVGGHGGAVGGSGVGFFTFPVTASCGSSTTAALCLQGRFAITTKWRTNPTPGPRPTATGTWWSPAPTRGSSGSSARTTGR